MGDLKRFLKANKKVKENVMYAATQSLCGEDGKPLEWEIKQISTKEDEAIRESCTKEVQVTGKPGLFRPKLDTKAYLAKVACACIVEPNLNNAELQDSYGVMKPEDLLAEMIDNPGEYQDLMQFIQQLNGFNVTMQDKVDQAKN